MVSYNESSQNFEMLVTCPAPRERRCVPLCFKSSDSNANLIEKNPQRHTQKMGTSWCSQVDTWNQAIQLFKQALAQLQAPKHFSLFLCTWVFYCESVSLHLSTELHLPSTWVLQVILAVLRVTAVIWSNNDDCIESTSSSTPSVYTPTQLKQLPF